MWWINAVVGASVPIPRPGGDNIRRKRDHFPRTPSALARLPNCQSASQGLGRLRGFPVDLALKCNALYFVESDFISTQRNRTRHETFTQVTYPHVLVSRPATPLTLISTLVLVFVQSNIVESTGWPKQRSSSSSTSSRPPRWGGTSSSAVGSKCQLGNASAVRYG
jgi:hypothetical protein